MEVGCVLSSTGDTAIAKRTRAVEKESPFPRHRQVPPKVRSDGCIHDRGKSTKNPWSSSCHNQVQAKEIPMRSESKKKVGNRARLKNGLLLSIWPCKARLLRPQRCWLDNHMHRRPLAYPQGGPGPSGAPHKDRVNPLLLLLYLAQVESTTIFAFCFPFLFFPYAEG